MFGHHDRRDIVVKEKHDGTCDTVNYKIREKHYGASSATSPTAAKHAKLQKLKQKLHIPQKPSNTTTTTTTVPPLFVSPPPITTPAPIAVSSIPTLSVTPPLSSISATLPPLLDNTAPLIVDTPPIPEPLNGTQLTASPPLVPVAEVTNIVAPPVPTFQYLPEHSYIAYDPVRFASTPPTPPVVTTTYIVQDTPALTAGSTWPTVSTTTTKSATNQPRYNIRMKEKIVTNSAAPGTDPVLRQHKLRERIRTKA